MALAFGERTSTIRVVDGRGSGPMNDAPLMVPTKAPAGGRGWKTQMNSGSSLPASRRSRLSVPRAICAGPVHQTGWPVNSSL
jgi:hypothetical protein